MALVPVMRVRPDFLDVEGNPAAEIHRLVFLCHAKSLIVLEGLKRCAVVAHIVEAPLDDDQILIDHNRDAAGDPDPLLCKLTAMMRQQQLDGNREPERQRGVLVLQAKSGEQAEPEEKAADRRVSDQVDWRQFWRRP
jgi:hypothetical protein